MGGQAVCEYTLMCFFTLGLNVFSFLTPGYRIIPQASQIKNKNNKKHYKNPHILLKTRESKIIPARGDPSTQIAFQFFFPLPLNYFLLLFCCSDSWR